MWEGEKEYLQKKGYYYSPQSEMRRNNKSNLAEEKLLDLHGEVISAL